jgi:hypothetical protein
MSLGQQCQVLALIWMRQNVSSFSPQNGNGIARSIKMIFGNDPLHTKAAVNVVLLFRSDNIQGWFGLKQKRGNSSKRFSDDPASQQAFGPVSPQPIKR